MDFLKNLDELTQLYEGLYDVLLREREALIGAQLDAVTELAKNKEALLYKIRAAEKVRQFAALQFAKQINFKSQDVRLLAMADHCQAQGDLAMALTLRERHKILQMQVTRAQEQNEENEIYASAALRILQGAVRDITQTVTEKPTYGKMGKLAGTTETQSGNFVKREA
jgi:hypothetical protein